MNKKERESRVIAKGEHSNHSHIITGDAVVERNDKGEILITLGNEDAVLKHLLETEWMVGNEKWTGEHTDINLSELDEKIQVGQVGIRHGDVALEKVAARTYKYIAQQEYDPYDKVIKQVQD